MDADGSLEQIDQGDYNIYTDGIKLLQGDLTKLEVSENNHKLYHAHAQSSTGTPEAPGKTRETVDKAEQYLKSSLTPYG